MSGNNRCASAPHEIPVCLCSGCFNQLLLEGQKVNIWEKNLHEEGLAQVISKYRYQFFIDHHAAQSHSGAWCLVDNW